MQLSALTTIHIQHLTFLFCFDEVFSSYMHAYTYMYIGYYTY